MTEPITICRGEGRLAVRASLVSLGDDLLAWVVGGTREHIGAVALAAVRPSLADPAERSFTPFLLTVPGHKEDGPALEGAAVLSKATGRTVVLVVGLHVDDATSNDIRALVANARTAIEGLAQKATP